jgi:hypothetical protein
MGTTPGSTPPKPKTAQVSATIPAHLADWLKETAETRMIGQGLLVAKGLELLKDHLEPDPLTTRPEPRDPGRPTSTGT